METIVESRMFMVTTSIAAPSSPRALARGNGSRPTAPDSRRESQSMHQSEQNTR